MTLLEIGRVIKPHGLKGEVVVDLVTNRLERLAVGSRLSLDPGLPAVHELEVLASRPQQHRFLVLFAGLNSREDAEALRNQRLLAEAAEDPDEAFVHELIGADLYDQDGTRRGTITAVEANPASDLLVVEDRYFVPMRFVVSRGEGRVDVEVPDGLFDV